MRKYFVQIPTAVHRLMIRRLVRLGRHLEAHYPLPTRPTAVSTAVRQALALPTALSDPPESQALAGQLRSSAESNGYPSSRELFFLDAKPLPCWQESDLTLYDDWLTAADYYPVYYQLFKRLSLPERTTRLLEIGVRTGYMGAVFAQAARGQSLYVGVDPNLYVPQGLQLAGATFRQLRARLPYVDFVLIEGYSWDGVVQNSLRYSAPFDIIHIDGDHTLTGKLLDLELARQLIAPDGLILVDDYEYHSIVAEAIRRAWRLGWFTEFAFIPTKRGLAALR